MYIDFFCVEWTNGIILTDCMFPKIWFFDMVQKWANWNKTKIIPYMANSVP
jgi:hypothetical protein